MRAALFQPNSIRNTATVLLCLLLFGVYTTAEQELSNWRQGNALASGSAAAGALQANSADDLNNGTCGYGPLQHQRPFLAGAAFSSHNTAITGLPMNGCGTCWEVQCIAAAPNEVKNP
ncbi:TPA: hypothetical protein ACH3X1_009068 [Trebouxia sp. C0004]